MNVPLPLPNPQDWASPAYAMGALGVTQQTLWRLSGGAQDNPTHLPKRLHRYYPIGATDPMYWRAEVDALVQARATAKGTQRAGRV